MLKDSHHSEETKKRIGAAHKSKIVSQITKERLRVAQTGKKATNETRQKMSAAGLGRHHSIKTKQQMSLSATGNKNNWKGGYYAKNIPLYDTYVHKFEPMEQCRRNKIDANILEVKCTYCGKWYMPKARDVNNRISGINGFNGYRFYCSNECKKECPIYYKQRHYKGQQGYNSREVQPELRQLVFERDNWARQRCGSTCSLHCHHIEPVKSNPIESADIDQCITFYVDCHQWSHTNISGCGYAELRNCA